MKAKTRYGWEYCDGDDHWYKDGHNIYQWHSHRWQLTTSDGFVEDFKSFKEAAAEVAD